MWGLRLKKKIRAERVNQNDGKRDMKNRKRERLIKRERERKFLLEKRFFARSNRTHLIFHNFQRWDKSSYFDSLAPLGSILPSFSFLLSHSLTHSLPFSLEVSIPERKGETSNSRKEWIWKRFKLFKSEKEIRKEKFVEFMSMKTDISLLHNFIPSLSPSPSLIYSAPFLPLHHFLNESVTEGREGGKNTWSNRPFTPLVIFLPLLISFSFFFLLLSLSLSPRINE